MKKIIVLLLACLFMFLGCAEVPASDSDILTETERIYTVTFDSLGGSYVEQQAVVWGEKVVAPPSPTKKCNCVFDGWYLGDEKWSFIGYTVTENITLTAKWIDCFGLTEKEIESIKDLLEYYYDGEYTWRDIESLQKEDPYIDYTGRTWEDLCEYNITFKNGKKCSYPLRME